MICVNDLHPEKAYLPILATEEEIVICSTDEHEQKEVDPIVLINHGIVMSS